MPVPDKDDVTPGQMRLHPCDDAGGPRRHLLDALAGCLPGDHTVAEDVPVGAGLGPDVGGRSAFVPAVVPLPQVLVDLCCETSQLGGDPGPLETRGQDEHDVEVQRGEPVCGLGRLGPATLGERQVRGARVAPIAAPLSLTVSKEDESSGGDVRHELRLVRQGLRGSARGSAEDPHTPTRR